MKFIYQFKKYVYGKSPVPSKYGIDMRFLPWKKSIFDNHCYKIESTNDIDNSIEVIKTNQLYNLSQWWFKAISLLHVWSQSIYSFRRYDADKPVFNILWSSVTLKMRLRSPNSNQLLSISQQFISASSLMPNFTSTMYFLVSLTAIVTLINRL